MSETGMVEEVAGKGIMTKRASETVGLGGGRGGSGGSSGGGRSGGGRSGGSSRDGRGGGSGGGRGDGSSEGGRGSGNGGGGSSKDSKDEKILDEDEIGRDEYGQDEKGEAEDTDKSGDEGKRYADEKQDSDENGDLRGGNEEEGSKALKSSPSDARMTEWRICFTDEETHQLSLAESRHGKIGEGEKLVINFKSRIVDRDNRVWESVVKPPLTIEVCGPGDFLYYVEYRQTGMAETEEPFAREKEKLRQWLVKAKEQEVEWMGEEIRHISDERVLVIDQQGNESRLLAAAGRLLPGQEQVMYTIGKNIEPTGTVLKIVYGDGIIYSQHQEERLTVGEDVYTITRFALKRKADKEECHHKWALASVKEPSCSGSGQKAYQCGYCGMRRESVLPAWGHEDQDGDGICDRCQEETEPGKPDPIHWNVGDVLEVEINEELFPFRCIDQNYSDQGENHRQAALFLCDQVIPADFASFYSYEKGEDGVFDYVFHPGPIANFGDSNEYKYSRIRHWLKEWEKNVPFGEDISLGVSFAYTGYTEEGKYRYLNWSNLKSSYIGMQKMTDKLFILSVDEAVRYRDWLWRFDGVEEENPGTQCNGFSKGYWLRSPAGERGNHDTEYVYVVDLARGNIRPAPVSYAKTADEEDLRTAAIGVRPAFVVAQE